MTLAQFSAVFDRECAAAGVHGASGAEMMRRIVGTSDASGPGRAAGAASADDLSAATASSSSSSSPASAGTPGTPALGLAVRPLMLAAVRALRSQGLKTGIVTNNYTGDGSDALIERAFTPLFDTVVQSCREGVRKPDPRIFLRACERLGVAPGRTVFLDDIGANLKGAAALGMATIRVGVADTTGAEAIPALEGRLGLRLLSAAGALLRKARL
jgi:hypothetical protein